MPPFKNILSRKKTKEKEVSKVKTSGLSDQPSQKSPVTPSTEQSFNTQSLPSAASTNTSVGPQSPISARDPSLQQQHHQQQQPPTPSSPNVPNSGAVNPESMDVVQDTIMENSHPQQAAQQQQQQHQGAATQISNLVHPTSGMAIRLSLGPFRSSIFLPPFSLGANPLVLIICIF